MIAKQPQLTGTWSAWDTTKFISIFCCRSPVYLIQNCIQLLILAVKGPVLSVSVHHWLCAMTIRLACHDDSEKLLLSLPIWVEDAASFAWQRRAQVCYCLHAGQQFQGHLFLREFLVLVGYFPRRDYFLKRNCAEFSRATGNVSRSFLDHIQGASQDLSTHCCNIEVLPVWWTERFIIFQ